MGSNEWEVAGLRSRDGASLTLDYVTRKQAE